MKKAISLIAILAMLLGAVSALAAAPSYDYPTKDFFNQPIPEPKAPYIPDGTPIISMVQYLAASNFDTEAFINSEYGEVTSIFQKTSYSGYLSDMDENLIAYWKDQGVVKEGFNLDNEDKADDYYVYTPADMEEGALYPLLFVSHGGGSNCFAVEGMGFINMIPEEKFILATAEDTGVENLYAIYGTVTENYPVDKTRVYATGTSAGGMASVSFAVAYPELIAAIAPNDIAPSLSAAEEQLSKLRELVVPMNFTTGLADKYYPYPLTGAGFDGQPKVNGYNTLLSAFGMDAYAMDPAEVDALVADSMDIIEHATGIRFPSVRPVNYINNRLYVADFANADGVTVLRINIVENKPHMFTGYDARNAWDFMKQFSRDLETGALKVN